MSRASEIAATVRRSLSPLRLVGLFLFGVTLAFAVFELANAWAAASDPTRPPQIRPLIDSWRVSSSARFVALLVVPPALLFPTRRIIPLRVLAAAACVATLLKLVDAAAYNWVVWRLAGLGTDPFQLVFAAAALFGAACALWTVVRDAFCNVAA